MPEPLERRSAERVPIWAEMPVYFRVLHDGTEVEMLVENLGMDGASLIGMCETFIPGQRLSDATLVFSDTDTVQIDVRIRWELWPRVGIEFDSLSMEAADRITKLLMDFLTPDRLAITQKVFF